MQCFYLIRTFAVGTGGRAEECSKRSPAELFVLVNGDTYLAIAYGELVESLRKQIVAADCGHTKNRPRFHNIYGESYA